MIEYGKNIIDGDYVRLATWDEYCTVQPEPSDHDRKILEKYGGKAYRVIGAKYNGKIILSDETEGARPFPVSELEGYAFPPKILYPWHKENEHDSEISMTDFENMIGVKL